MKKGFFVSLLAFFVFMPIQWTDAATLYMDPSQAELKRGDIIVVSVRLDAGDDECVNVVDGVITYTENIQPVDISRGQSILSMWVEEPVINKENRTITFAGGIPNGYCGRIPGDPRLTNNVVDLLFQSPGLQIGTTENGNQVSIDFAPETQVLLNDGFGTLAQTMFFGTKINLTKEAGNAITNPWQEAISNDNISPEKFSIALVRIPDESSDYNIVFNTTDKQSGIDHYEVIEEPLTSKNLFNWGAQTAPWVTARSPYLLDDQSLNSTIRVKAVDKAGNEYIAVYLPSEGQRTMSTDMLMNIGIITAITFVLIAGIGIAATVYRKRKKTAKSGVGVEINPSHDADSE